MIEHILGLEEFLNEAGTKVNWVMPSSEQLKKEYQHEVVEKGTGYFSSEKKFLNAVKKGYIMNVSKAFDKKIEYRSHTKSFDELLDLIKGYKSYPQIRNENTLTELYNEIKNGEKMDLPIVINVEGDYIVMSGNTRMDIAFQLNKNVEALIIDAE